MKNATAADTSATGAVHWSLRFAIAAALLALPASAQAGPACVALKERPLQAIGAIHLLAEGQPPWLDAVVARAASMWNDPDCNVARSFPQIVLAATREPHRRLWVRWEAGFNRAEPRSCGSFGGNEIILFGSAIHPATRELGTCGTTDRIVETLAHEIGHALGLLDRFEPECYGSIMSQLVWVRGNAVLPRTVRPSECAAADIAFETPAERRWPGRQPRLLAAISSTAAGDGAAARSLATLPGQPERLLPRSARTAPGSPATMSSEFHP